jgi:hypothetical protein
VDATAPVISGVAATASNNTATISWTTAEASTTEVTYGTSPTSLGSTVTVATLVTSHTVTLTGLANNATYYYRVSSRDAVGNVATSPDPPASPGSFTVTAGLISLTPSSVSIKRGTLRSGSAANLSAADNAYFEVNSTTSGSPRIARWEASFASVPRSLMDLSITYQGTNSLECAQSLSLYDWSTDTWKGLDTRSVGPSGGPITINPSGITMNYVSGTSASGTVKVRFQCTASTDFYSRGDLLRISFYKP